MPRLALVAVLLCATAARADEIRLKDGTKITGTIVGFEDVVFPRRNFLWLRADPEEGQGRGHQYHGGEKGSRGPKAKSTAAPLPPSAPPSTSAPAVVSAVAKEPALARPYHLRIDETRLRRNVPRRQKPKPYRPSPRPLLLRHPRHPRRLQRLRPRHQRLNQS